MKILWIFLTILSAFALGKRVFFWAVMSFMFSWVALIACIAIPANQKRLDARQEQLEELTKDKVEELVVQKEFKHIKTVDDLFNQLEKPKGTSNGMPNL
jgi:hypothetical protein